MRERPWTQQRKTGSNTEVGHEGRNHINLLTGRDRLYKGFTPSTLESNGTRLEYKCPRPYDYAVHPSPPNPPTLQPRETKTKREP